MSSVMLCGFLLLLVDAWLTWALWRGLLLAGGGAFANASAVKRWAASALKWALLDATARVVAAKKQRVVPRRLAAMLALLPALLWAEPAGPPGMGAPLQVALCSALSCLFWEAGFSGGGSTPEGEWTPDARRLLARLLRYFRPDFRILTAGFGFIILTVTCDTLVPWFQGSVTDELRGGTLDSGFYAALAALACFSAASCVFSGLRAACFKITHGRLNKRLREALFRTLLAQEVLFFQEKPTGSLCSLLESDVHQLGLTVTLNANAVLRSSVKSVLMLAAMLYLSRPLTALACVEIPVMAALQRRQVRRRKELKEQKQDSLARLQQLSHQSLGGIRTVRSFRGQADEARRFHRELRRLGDIDTRDRQNKAFFIFLRRLGGLLTKTAMLLAARSLVSDGRLSVGTLLTFLLFRKPMSHNLKEIFVCAGDTLATVGIISKVFGYLDRSPKLRADGRLAPAELRGEVVFRKVTFGYPARDKAAVKDVSMVLEAGKVTALVGPSGSGKTSCVSLLKRLYQPQRGDILLDGQPLHAYGNAYLHRKVLLVPQQPVVMRGSLRYNLEYGLGACDWQLARELAARIEARRLLAKLEGRDHAAADVQGGTHLSEGDKQSMALLRALLRQPRVLILDEATSHMDVHAQHAALEEVVACGCTVLMVAHRLASVERAHRVVFMEDGVVTEQGTHAQLMAKGGRYWRLREELFDHRL